MFLSGELLPEENMKTFPLQAPVCPHSDDFFFLKASAGHWDCCSSELISWLTLTLKSLLSLAGSGSVFQDGGILPAPLRISDCVTLHICVSLFKKGLRRPQKCSGKETLRGPGSKGVSVYGASDLGAEACPKCIWKPGAPLLLGFQLGKLPSTINRASLFLAELGNRYIVCHKIWIIA